MLTDVAISGDKNGIKKEAEKILKYKDLITEIQHIWYVKAKVIPVITGGPGTVSKSLRQYLSNMSGKHEIKDLQKNSHTGHCTHTVESVYARVQNIYHGAITLHIAQIANTEQLQHYIP
jgi:2-oxoglutarate dehydrogenase complex dehydrogenase (E1) component-like enzyme